MENLGWRGGELVRRLHELELSRMSDASKLRKGGEHLAAELYDTSARSFREAAELVSIVDRLPESARRLRPGEPGYGGS